MTSFVLTHAQQFAQDNSIVTHLDNWIQYVDAEYIALVDNGAWFLNRVFFYKKCYTREQYTELNNNIRGEIRVIDYYPDENIVVIESFNVPTNKGVIIKLRRER